MTAGWREGALHGPWDEPTTLFLDLLLAGWEPVPDERGLTIWERQLSPEDRDALALHRAGYGAG